MKHEFENKSLENYPNLLNKLQNSLADLDFYQQRIEAGYCSHLPSDALPQISFWRQRILKANPENANELFYSCWRFVHDFDLPLRKCSK